MFAAHSTHGHLESSCEVGCLCTYSAAACFTNYRYMVTQLMPVDLDAFINSQPLADDHVQLFIYQILRALKVCPSGT